MCFGFGSKVPISVSSLRFHGPLRLGTCLQMHVNGGAVAIASLFLCCLVPRRAPWGLVGYELEGKGRFDFCSINFNNLSLHIFLSGNIRSPVVRITSTFQTHHTSSCFATLGILVLGFFIIKKKKLNLFSPLLPPFF